MLQELSLPEYHRVRDLFSSLDYNLAVGSILAGRTPARVWVDDPRAPSAAFTAFKHRWFLAGSPKNKGFQSALGHLLAGTVIPQMQAAGQESFVLHYDTPEWEESLEVILPGRHLRKGQRSYLECSDLRQNWRDLLPPGFILRPVDAGLVSQLEIENLEELRAELCSERTSVADFLEKGFGFCVLHNQELAAWCLSEYNTGERCEIGVATVEKYQRLGLGTATTLALVEHALERGYQRIGWHSWERNTPSISLALRSGFSKIRDDPVYLCFLGVSEM